MFGRWLGSRKCLFLAYFCLMALFQPTAMVQTCGPNEHEFCSFSNRCHAGAIARYLLLMRSFVQVGLLDKIMAYSFADIFVVVYVARSDSDELRTTNVQWLGHLHVKWRKSLECVL